MEFSTLTPIRFFRLAASASPRSSVSWLLVPCSRNWPVYFSSFAVFWWGLYETYRYTREPDRTTPGWWPGGWSSSTGTAACTGLTWRLLKLFRWESNSFHCHKYNLRPFSCYPPLNYSLHKEIAATPFPFSSYQIQWTNLFPVIYMSLTYILFQEIVVATSSRRFTGMVDDITVLPTVSPHTLACSQISEL